MGVLNDYVKYLPMLKDSSRGCTGKFSVRKSKKPFFGSTYATKIGQAGHAKSGFFPTPSLAYFTYFIQRHNH
jgi:hypothetical protein